MQNSKTNITREDTLKKYKIQILRWARRTARWCRASTRTPPSATPARGSLPKWLLTGGFIFSLVDLSLKNINKKKAFLFYQSSITDVPHSTVSLTSIVCQALWHPSWTSCFQFWPVLEAKCSSGGVLYGACSPLHLQAPTTRLSLSSPPSPNGSTSSQARWPRWRNLLRESWSVSSPLSSDLQHGLSLYVSLLPGSSSSFVLSRYHINPSPWFVI